MNRRSFLKRCGILAGASFVAPKLVLQTLECPDFVPGMRYTNAVIMGGDDWRKLSETERMQTTFNARHLLEEWLKNTVPERYIKTSNIKTYSKLFDWGTKFGMCIEYTAPLKPII
jgi:hypothetical protein